MRVWQAVNLVDDTVITFRNLRFVLRSMRKHETTYGHFLWKLRSFVAPANQHLGISSPLDTPEFLYAEV